MKKIVRLTEFDLMRIVKRVIEEQINETNMLMTENKIQQIKDLVNKTGTYGTVEAFGGIDDFYRYISSQGELGDILVFMIKKLVDKLSKNVKVLNRAGLGGSSGFDCMDAGFGPFYFDTVECEEEKSIEFFGVNYAKVNHYFYDECDDDGDPVHSDVMDVYTESYENFSDSVLKDMLQYLLEISERKRIY